MLETPPHVLDKLDLSLDDIAAARKQPKKAGDPKKRPCAINGEQDHHLATASGEPPGLYTALGAGNKKPATGASKVAARNPAAAPAVSEPPGLYTALGANKSKPAPAARKAAAAATQNQPATSPHGEPPGLYTALGSGSKKPAKSVPQPAVQTQAAVLSSGEPPGLYTALGAGSKKRSSQPDHAAAPGKRPAASLRLPDRALGQTAAGSGAKKQQQQQGAKGASGGGAKPGQPRAAPGARGKATLSPAGTLRGGVQKPPHQPSRRQLLAAAKRDGGGNGPVRTAPSTTPRNRVGIKTVGGGSNATAAAAGGTAGWTSGVFRTSKVRGDNGGDGGFAAAKDPSVEYRLASFGEALEARFCIVDRCWNTILNPEDVIPQHVLRDLHFYQRRKRGQYDASMVVWPDKRKPGVKYTSWRRSAADAAAAADDVLMGDPALLAFADVPPFAAEAAAGRPGLQQAPAGKRQKAGGDGVPGAYQRQQQQRQQRDAPLLVKPHVAAQLFDDLFDISAPAAAPAGTLQQQTGRQYMTTPYNPPAHSGGRAAAGVPASYGVGKTPVAEHRAQQQQQQKQRPPDRADLYRDSAAAPPPNNNDRWRPSSPPQPAARDPPRRPASPPPSRQASGRALGHQHQQPSRRSVSPPPRQAPRRDERRRLPSPTLLQRVAPRDAPRDARRPASPLRYAPRDVAHRPTSPVRHASSREAQRRPAASPPPPQRRAPVELSRERGGAPPTRSAPSARVADLDRRNADVADPRSTRGALTAGAGRANVRHSASPRDDDERQLSGASDRSGEGSEPDEEGSEQFDDDDGVAGGEGGEEEQRQYDDGSEQYDEAEEGSDRAADEELGDDADDAEEDEGLRSDEGPEEQDEAYDDEPDEEAAPPAAEIRAPVARQAPQQRQYAAPQQQQPAGRQQHHARQQQQPGRQQQQQQQQQGGERQQQQQGTGYGRGSERHGGGQGWATENASQNRRAVDLLLQTGGRGGAGGGAAAPPPAAQHTQHHAPQEAAQPPGPGNVNFFARALAAALRYTTR